jgi:hypothetical protein
MFHINIFKEFFMSDTNTNGTVSKEKQWQDIYTRAYKDLLMTAGFAGLGYVLVCMGLQGFHNNVLVAIGMFAAVAPVLWKWFNSRSINSLFYWRDYEIITTYSDGSKSSDRGAQSTYAGLAHMIAMFFIVCIASGIVTITKLFYLCIKSSVAYLKLKGRPSFLFGPFFVMIVGLAVLIGAPMLSLGIGQIRLNVQTAQEIKERTAVYPELIKRESELSVQEIRSIIEELSNKSYRSDLDQEFAKALNALKQASDSDLFAIEEFRGYVSIGIRSLAFNIRTGIVASRHGDSYGFAGVTLNGVVIDSTPIFRGEHIVY